MMEHITPIHELSVGITDVFTALLILALWAALGIVYQMIVQRWINQGARQAIDQMRPALILANTELDDKIAQATQSLAAMREFIEDVHAPEDDG